MLESCCYEKRKTKIRQAKNVETDVTEFVTDGIMENSESV